MLLREGIARILAEAGCDVVAQAGDADDLLRKTLSHHPDVAVVDVQMPPRRENDGLVAAMEVRRRLPRTGVLVLSQFYEESYAVDLIGDHAEGVGYLLKERVGDVAAFVDAVQRVAAGGSAIDPQIVSRMLGRRRQHGPLDDLTPRERDVLKAMAEGKSNPRHRRYARGQRGRGREAHPGDLPEARHRPDRHRASPRARGADLHAQRAQLIPAAGSTPR